MTKAAEDYIKYLKWAVFTVIDRSNYDDGKSRIRVEALFNYSSQARDHYDYPNKDIKRYFLPIDLLGRFEEFYNFIQDLKKEYGEYYIFHLNDKYFSVDEQNRFRHMLEF